ncbi:MAG: hypothetical protein M3535_07670 [Actinomycetota bacterium]|nr:hypothetical protein [Actinomycetota bacterium]
MLSTATTLALTITWDPTIRGILVVLVSFLILCGSAYLLLSTNVGSRLGFLIAAAGFWGWMAIMGAAWWVYGIGLEGAPAAWVIEEVLTTTRPGDTSDANLVEARDLSMWRELPEGDVIRGEAQTAADEALTGEESTVARFETSDDYVTTDAFAIGGREVGSIASRIPGPSPAQYAIIQVQPAVEVVTLEEGQACPPEATCIEFGETPPSAEPVEGSPVISVIMVRDLGSARLPPAIVTLSSAVIFGIVCNTLHRRDKAAAEHREQVSA